MSDEVGLRVRRWMARVFASCRFRQLTRLDLTCFWRTVVTGVRDRASAYVRLASVFEEVVDP